MADVCTPSVATSTVFSTITNVVTTRVVGTITSLIPTESQTLITVTDTGRGNVVTERTLISTVTATLTSLVRAVVTTESTVLSSTPISTLFAPCSVTTTTPASTTTTTTTATTPSAVLSTTSSTTVAPTTTPASSTTRRGTTVFSTTFVSQSSSTSSGTSAIAAANIGKSSSKAPAGAIAGGVVGGLAALAIGAALVWWFSTRSSRRHRSNKFDFDGGDPWDPAAGVAGRNSFSKRGSRGHGPYQPQNDHDGGGMNMGAMGAGAALGGAAAASRDREQHSASGSPGGNDSAYDGSRRSSITRKKVPAAQEQFDYYSSIPRALNSADDATAGMAGVGLAASKGRFPSASLSNDGDAYTGLEEPEAGIGATAVAGEGGWGVANQMHAQQPQSNGNLRNGGPPGPQGIARDPYQPQSGFAPRQLAGNNQRGPPAPPGPVYPSHNGSHNQYQNRSQPQQNPHPYAAGSNFGNNAELMAPSPNRFGGAPAQLASPAPSHRSIPTLGAFYHDDNRRGGTLRVTNEEPEEEDARFSGGGGGGAYDDLTSGLGSGGQSWNGSDTASRAPTYRTRE